jgi:hypothetical protein
VNEKPALVICTKGGPHLSVLLQSLRVYLPHGVAIYLSGATDKLFTHTTVNLPNKADNFGDAYNFAVKAAFNNHSSVVVANDDIVLTPYSWRVLMEDVEMLSEKDGVGWVGARSDYARGFQNIRYRHQGDENGFLLHESEKHVLPTAVIAPIFAHINKEAWVDFPSINWFSDDIQCFDMSKRGFQHYVSRSYIHHIGSQSVGQDFERCTLEGLEWCRDNRPDFVSEWFGSPQ